MSDPGKLPHEPRPDAVKTADAVTRAIGAAAGCAVVIALILHAAWWVIAVIAVLAAVIWTILLLVARLYVRRR